MVEVMQPTPRDRICDPAAGTGGFLFNAYQYVLDRYGNYYYYRADSSAKPPGVSRMRGRNRKRA